MINSLEGTPSQALTWKPTFELLIDRWGDPGPLRLLSGLFSGGGCVRTGIHPEDSPHRTRAEYPRQECHQPNAIRDGGGPDRKMQHGR